MLSLILEKEEEVGQREKPQLGGFVHAWLEMEPVTWVCVLIWN